MKLDDRALHAWTTGVSGDDELDAELAVDQAVDQAVEGLLDAATRLMGFARSAQADPLLARGRAVDVLRDLRVKVDTSVQLARLETAR